MIQKKRRESDELIDHCGQMLKENRVKLQQFNAQLSMLDIEDISPSKKQSTKKLHAQIEAQAHENDDLLEQSISDFYSSMETIN